MTSPFQVLRMSLAQQGWIQQLARTSEPKDVTDAADNVAQYDHVMTTKLAVAYASGIEILGRTTACAARGIDCACGPGHFTRCLVRYLQCHHLVGVDLSERMIELASKAASSEALDDRIKFCIGNVTDLVDIGERRFDLSTFTDAAHHMRNLNTVSQVIREMSRVTKPDGLVMIMDLVRLRTTQLTEKYVNTLGHDYVERGLPNFFEDFRNSMYAAWTVKELRQAIPAADSRRWWCHIVPRGLPTVQIVLGLPVGRKKPFVRPGFPPGEHPLIREWYARWEAEVSAEWAKETLREWKLMRLTLRFASKHMIPPGKP